MTSGLPRYVKGMATKRKTPVKKRLSRKKPNRVDYGSWAAGAVGFVSLMLFGFYGQNCGGAQPTVVGPVVVDPPMRPDPTLTEVKGPDKVEPSKTAVCKPPFSLLDLKRAALPDFKTILVQLGSGGHLELVSSTFYAVELDENGVGAGSYQLLMDRAGLEDQSVEPKITVVCESASKQSRGYLENVSVYGVDRVFANGIFTGLSAISSSFDSKGHLIPMLDYQPKRVGESNFFSDVERLLARVNYNPLNPYFEGASLYFVDAKHIEVRMQEFYGGVSVLARHIYRIYPTPQPVSSVLRPGISVRIPGYSQ